MPGTRRKSSDAPLDDVPSEELLRTSPFEGDLAEELAAAEPRQERRIPSATVFLGAGVLIVAGFLGGVQADKHWGAKQAPAGFSSFARGAGGAAGAGGQGTGGGFGAGTARRGGFGEGAGSGQGGVPGEGAGTGQGGRPAAPGTAPGSGTGAAPSGGAGTSGTVKLVDGDVIYVQTANGIVRVKTTGSTKVSVTKSAKVKDLKAGAPVVVQGTPGQDGSVTATTVTQNR
ncbi:hypothetical protein NE236_16965 [Actinoallomurus purpureus]|uniref:hypothetical protein n=1 Tax=Actinoallomurus purpureus TaxID=478114 RepID=UPI002093A022|nr:hypothetical protein [Actinoallomurus purpureus]MCO6006678.1 hypothetical protein [Actinoallomurus purpureus]